ncbi:hypothetical protein LHP98_03180 [Rhodobacter sp. Har01]|uniref:hypothetical protein n=1 Tax=Rhodobacter sp. Har01 TaxID=2883999 RepID=UPI001D084C68|nr:hypothetical protein [Rhodobacter sp. Har01]MCB6177132.1 hypothetical protein [Rhodobacter sp. Har01]
MRAYLSSAILATLALASPGLAATLTAQPLGFFEGFSIEFDDTNNNKLFDLPELTSFSGMTIRLVTSTLLDTVIGVPAIAGISTEATLPGVIALAPDHWSFDAAGSTELTTDLSAGAVSWSYQITGLSPVPLPASLPLLAGGLVLLAARRRRNAA